MKTGVLVTMRLERAPLSVAETVLLLVEMKDGKTGFDKGAVCLAVSDTTAAPS